jgi:hypothetical protein
MKFVLWANFTHSVQIMLTKVLVTTERGKMQSNKTLHFF